MINILYRDLWTPVWPNLLASALWTWPLLAWHHARIRRHIDTMRAAGPAADTDHAEHPESL